jgi:hypothetical protein
MNHARTLASLSAARDFLVAHPDLPTPDVQARASTWRPLTLTWHVEHDDALTILRAFPDWGWTASDPTGDHRRYELEHDGLALTIFTSATATVLEPVNLLDALAEVSA